MPVKIAMVCASVSRSAGGVFDALRGLSTALLERDQIVVVGGRDACTDTDLQTWGAVSVEPVSIPCFRALGYAPGMTAALEASDADIVHAHGLWLYPSIAARRFADRRSIPRVVTPHGMLDPWALANSGWKKRLAGMAFETGNLRSASCLHALNASEAASIRSHGLTNPICTIPNGVELPSSLSTAAPPWPRREGERILLFLGRLHPKKGLPLLLEAFSRQPIGGHTASWRLVIAGWSQDGHDQELANQARTLGIDSRIHFTGPLYGEAKSAALSSADAFVLPSLSEGLPMAVLEAWAHSRPVLMTDACNLAIGRERSAALICPAGIGPLTGALGDLMGSSAADLGTMGANGRRLVEERFDWKRIALSMSEVYRWLADDGPRPDCIQMP